MQLPSNNSSSTADSQSHFLDMNIGRCCLSTVEPTPPAALTFKSALRESDNVSCMKDRLQFGDIESSTNNRCNNSRNTYSGFPNLSSGSHYGDAEPKGSLNATSFKSLTAHKSKTSLEPSSSISSTIDSSATLPSSTTSTSLSNATEMIMSPDQDMVGVSLRVSGQCSQGGRRYMEDFFSVAYQNSKGSSENKQLEYAFFGIFDGHGGAQAAMFAKEHLMLEIVNQKLFWSDSDEDVLTAIREGFIATHYAMWREHEQWPYTANGHLSTAGTTATIAFVRREKLYIGHVGDSGIVLGYQNENEDFWRAKQLTTDHKPESPAERERIHDSGGKVIVKSGVPRVVWRRPRNPEHRGPIDRNIPTDDIPFLAVARSLGDLWSYNARSDQFVVSPDPEVKVVKIDPKTFKCLIFGTDGLWNVVNAQEAVDAVYEKEMLDNSWRQTNEYKKEKLQHGVNPSKVLIDRALKTWSSKKMRADNTTVLTLILNPSGNENVNTKKTMGSATNIDTTCISEQEDNIQITEYSYKTSYHTVASKQQVPLGFRPGYCLGYYDEEEEEDGAEEGEDAHVNSCEWNQATAELWLKDVSDPDNSNTKEWVEFELATDIHRPGVAAVKRTHVVSAYQDDSEETCDATIYNDEADTYIEAVASASHDIHESDLAENSYESFIVHTNPSPEESSGYSFAESYNSLLNEHISNKASKALPSPTSNSGCSNSSPYQSIDSRSMQEILQEQQRYQQEEGYSLTKLETRREQQRGKYANVFNVYEQQSTGITSSSTTTIVAATAGGDWHRHNEPQDFSEENCEAADSRYKLERQNQLLELDSLLQRERDEEQQVAFEQREMRQRFHLKTSDSGLNTTNNPSSSSSKEFYIGLEESEEDEVESEEGEEIAQVDDDTVIDFIEELDDELVEDLDTVYSTPSSSDTIITKIEERLQELTGNSNSEDLPDISKTAEILRKTVEEIKQEGANAVSYIYEQIEKLKRIDCIPASKQLFEVVARAAEVAGSPNPLVRTTAHAKTPDATMSANSLAKVIRRMRYRNIPNENMMQTRRKSRNTKFKRKTQSFINNSAAAIVAYNAKSSTAKDIVASNIKIAINKADEASTGRCMNGASKRNDMRVTKRQLRSTVNSLVADLTQRTLRTRNTFTKDVMIIQNNSNTSNANVASSSSPTALIHAQKEPQKQKQQQQQQQKLLTPNQLLRQRVAATKAKAVAAHIMTGTKRTAAAAMLPNSYLNLRSRRSNNDNNDNNNAHSAHHQPIPSTPTATAAQQFKQVVAPASVAANTAGAVVKRGEYRRSLRRSTANGMLNVANGVIVGGSIPSGFSKTTRLQSTARPPPSPKKLNVSASLAVASGGGHTTVRTTHNVTPALAPAPAVLEDFSKRWSLRSNSNRMDGNTSSAAYKFTSAAAAATTNAHHHHHHHPAIMHSSLSNAISCYSSRSGSSSNNSNQNSNANNNAGIATRSRLNRKR